MVQAKVRPSHRRVLEAVVITASCSSSTVFTKNREGEVNTYVQRKDERLCKKSQKDRPNGCSLYMKEIKGKEGALGGVSLLCKVSAVRPAYTLLDEHQSRDHLLTSCSEPQEEKHGKGKIKCKHLKCQHILNTVGQKEIEIHRKKREKIIQM